MLDCQDWIRKRGSREASPVNGHCPETKINTSLHRRGDYDEEFRSCAACADGGRKENVGFVSVKIAHNIRTGHELPTVLPNNK